MKRLRELDLEAHLADPSRKQRFVTPMFDLIAPRYDRFTRVFSFGMDREWKAELIGLLVADVSPEALVLDVACGTGDLALGAARHVTRGRAIGIDASPRMIELARERARDGTAPDPSAGNSAPRELAPSNVEFRLGDLAGLEVPDASVDAVTAGYGLRNVPDHRRAIAEIARVLRPGGTLLTLDFYRPKHPLWRTLFLSYLSVAGNCLGWLWHREPVAYGYIARSIDHFVSWQAFAETLEEHGLRVMSVRRKLLGGVAIHHARRAETRP